MAEAAGLVIGAVSLAGLFTTCIDCMEYVSLGVNYAEDHEIALVKLLLLKARLIAWGEYVRAAHPGEELEALRRNWARESDVVGKSLVGIKRLFEKSDALQSAYGLERVDERGGAVAVAVASAAQASPGLVEIERAFESSVVARKAQTSFWKKATWAVHNKHKFDDLLSNLTFYIDNLEKLSDRLHFLDMQMQTLAKKMEPLLQRGSFSASLLLKAAEESDDPKPPSTSGPEITEPTRPASDTKGHLYLKNLITGNAKALLSDVGATGKQHEYKENEVSGNARVVMGNASESFAADFLR
jgi:hypothetical protein